MNMKVSKKTYKIGALSTPAVDSPSELLEQIIEARLKLPQDIYIAVHETTQDGISSYTGLGVYCLLATSIEVILERGSAQSLGRALNSAALSMATGEAA